MGAGVGIWIESGGGAQQRKPQDVTHGVVAIARLVSHAKSIWFAVLPRSGDIGPAQCRNLIAPAVVACGRPLDGSIGNLVGGMVTRSGRRKRGLQHHVLLMPIDLVVDIDQIRVRVQADGLPDASMAMPRGTLIPPAVYP